MHEFAAMSGVTDQALLFRIDHPIHQFQRHLTDQDRKVVGYLSHIAVTVAILDCQSDGCV